MAKLVLLAPANTVATDASKLCDDLKSHVVKLDVVICVRWHHDKGIVIEGNKSQADQAVEIARKDLKIHWRLKDESGSA